MLEVLKIEAAVNLMCPWCGKPIGSDSLTRYRGKLVGFCNTGWRDKFETAAAMFDGLIDPPSKNAK